MPKWIEKCDIHSPQTLIRESSIERIEVESNEDPDGNTIVFLTSGEQYTSWVSWEYWLDRLNDID